MQSKSWQMQEYEIAVTGSSTEVHGLTQLLSQVQKKSDKQYIQAWYKSVLAVDAIPSQHVPFIPAGSIDGSDRPPISASVFENKSSNPSIKPALSSASW